VAVSYSLMGFYRTSSFHASMSSRRHARRSPHRRGTQGGEREPDFDARRNEEAGRSARRDRVDFPGPGHHTSSPRVFS
jgi:hypothetical protein